MGRCFEGVYCTRGGVGAACVNGMTDVQKVSEPREGGRTFAPAVLNGAFVGLQYAYEREKAHACGSATSSPLTHPRTHSLIHHLPTGALLHMQCLSIAFQGLLVGTGTLYQGTANDGTAPRGVSVWLSPPHSPTYSSAHALIYPRTDPLTHPPPSHRCPTTYLPVP